jgi:hypothetical protein
MFYITFSHKYYARLAIRQGIVGLEAPQPEKRRRKPHYCRCVVCGTAIIRDGDPEPMCWRHENIPATWKWRELWCDRDRRGLRARKVQLPKGNWAYVIFDAQGRAIGVTDPCVFPKRIWGFWAKK